MNLQNTSTILLSAALLSSGLRMTPATADAVGGHGAIMRAPTTTTTSTTTTTLPRQTLNQRKCIRAMNRRGANVAREQYKWTKSCLHRALKGKEASPVTCTAGDARAKIAKAQAKVLVNETRRCVAEPPDFGYTDGATVNTASSGSMVDYIADIYGADLDASFILKSTDKSASKCQGVLASVARFPFKARVRQFADCKDIGMSEATIVDAAGLTGCFATVTADALGGIAKSLARLTRTVTGKCSGVDLDATFPGACVGAPDFATCVDAAASCRFCLMVNTIDGLAEDCDLYDNTVADGSCIP